MIPDEKLIDLKRRYERGEVSLEEIAAEMEVSLATATRWMRAPRSGSLEAYRRTLETRRWVRDHILDLVSLTVAAFALASSLLAIRSNQDLQRELATERSITDSYSTFYDLDRIALDHPRLSYLFASPAYYAAVEDDARVADSRLDVPAIAALRLEERQGASYVFDTFEETLFQYEHALRTDDRQTVFLKRDLDYLTNDALRNPRLLWYWDPAGGNLRSDYDAVTVRYFRDAVCRDEDLKRLEDRLGPFKNHKTPPQLKSRGNAEARERSKDAWQTRKGQTREGRARTSATAASARRREGSSGPIGASSPTSSGFRTRIRP